MANSVEGNVWVLDTVGIITEKAIDIRKIVLYPNAAGDAALLNYFNPGKLVTLGCGTIIGTAVTGTITGTNTLTMSAGTYLPAAIADGYVFELTGGGGLAANQNVKTLVATAGNNTVVVAQGAPWTNEAAQTYSWNTYYTYPLFPLLSPATERQIFQMDFPIPFHAQNLILETISANAKVYVYLAGLV